MVAKGFWAQARWVARMCSDRSVPGIDPGALGGRYVVGCDRDCVFLTHPPAVNQELGSGPIGRTGKKKGGRARTAQCLGSNPVTRRQLQQQASAQHALARGTSRSERGSLN
jgi:hypothetical protein